MKRKIVLGLALIGLMGICAGLYSYSPAPGLSDLAAPSGNFSKGAFPLWYTAIDTVKGTGHDTVKVNMRKNWVTNYNSNSVNSITYTVDLLTAATFTVTPVLTVNLYASANNAVTYDPTPLLSFTATPTSLTAPLTKTYSVTGNPYTDYMWTTAGTASTTCSAKYSLLLR